MKNYLIALSIILIGCGETKTEDTANNCPEIEEFFTMTNEEYNSYLSESGELTEESCTAICEGTEVEYSTIVGCELAGQTTADSEGNPATATVACTYQEEPCQ